MSLAIRLTHGGVEPLPRDERGVLLDEATGTRLLQGSQARAFLEERRDFPLETEVFVPADSEVELQAGVSSVHLGSSAAIFLQPGALAHCQVRSGSPIVLTTERAPHWYETFHPDRFGDFAREQGDRNEQLAGGYLRRAMLPPEVLDRLAGQGHLELHHDTFRFVGKSLEELTAGLEPAQAEAVESLWTRMKLNQLPGRVFGCFPRHELSAALRQSLTERGLLHEGLDGRCKWRTNARELPLDGLSGQDAERVRGLYHRTNRRHYDTTGMVYSGPGITAYQRAQKTNLWSHEPSEWLLSSGCLGAPVVGLSSVATEGALDRPTAFSELRPAETMHHHPPHGDQGMSEAYVVTGGSAALLAVQGGRPYLHLLHAGDLAVVPPGLSHCLLAAAGDYEHVVVQTPSTFQYGMKFKQDDPFPGSRPELEQRAVDELGRGTRGSLPL